MELTWKWEQFRLYTQIASANFTAYVFLYTVAVIYILWKNCRQNSKHSQKVKNISPKVVFLVSDVEDWEPAYAALLEDLSLLKVLVLTLIYSLYLFYSSVY